MAAKRECKVGDVHIEGLDEIDFLILKIVKQLTDCNLADVVNAVSEEPTCELSKSSIRRRAKQYIGHSFGRSDADHTVQIEFDRESELSEKISKLGKTKWAPPGRHRRYHTTRDHPYLEEHFTDVRTKGKVLSVTRFGDDMLNLWLKLQSNRLGRMITTEEEPTAQLTCVDVDAWEW